jgi:hypothetical protein
MILNLLAFAAQNARAEFPAPRAPQTFTWRDEDGRITKQTVDGTVIKETVG